MATYPVYPATTFTQAVELTIFASNQLHDVINGDALTTVETENGDIPTLRKALVDNFYFKTPINWVEGESSTVFNQLYYFDGTLATSGWYYAPQATVDNPIAMGSTPLDDDNWRLYQTATQSIPAQVFPWSIEITQVTGSIVPPYEFDTAIVTYNSAVLVPGKDYTITNNTLTFTPPLTPEPDAEVPDILFCYIGKVEEGNPNINYVTYNSLAAPTAAGVIGTNSGENLQTEINYFSDNIVLQLDSAFGNYEITLDTLTYVELNDAVGKLIHVKDTNVNYQILSQSATSYDYQGAGGVFYKIISTNGVYDIRAWPVVGDGVTNDTLYLQTAIDKVMSRGGGTLKITGSNKIYLFDYLVINRSKTPANNFDLRFTLEGDGSAILQHSGNTTNDSAFWIHGNLGSGSLDAVFTRGATLRNLYIKGDPTSDVRGIRLQRVSSLQFDRVIVENFGNSAMYLLDCYDSVFTGVELLRSGRVTNAAVANYGLLISGSYDQSNANHFFGLRIEHCPLILGIINGCRHNYFVASKFEQGRTNPTTNNPISIGEATETAFTGCQFVQNFSSDVPFLYISTAIFPYWATYGTEKVLQFSDCSFVCSSDKLSYWLNVNYAAFNNCVFSSCAGDISSCFTLGTNVSMHGTRIVMGSATASIFRITGSHVRIKDTKIRHFIQPTSGAFLNFSNTSTLTDVIIENFDFIDYEPLNPYSGHIDNMGDIIIKRKPGYTLSSTSDRLIYGPDILIYTGPTVTWTNVRNGYNGQKIVIFAQNSAVTLSNGSGAIVTTSGSDYVIAIGKTATLTHINGIWYQN